MSHFCTTLTLCSSFVEWFLRQRTTAYKGPYDELMIPLEIISLLGFLMYSSLFIALLNAYQLQGGVAQTSILSCLLDRPPFSSRCAEIWIIMQVL